MLKSLIAAGIVAGAATAATAAHATVVAPQPTIAYQVYDGASLIGSGSSNDGLILLGGGLDARFGVSLDASGAPFLTSPDFSSIDFSVTRHAGVSGTLTIKITDYNLPSYQGGTIANTFTLNSLNAPGFTSGTITNYVDATNTAFGTGTKLAQETYTGSGSFSDSASAALAAIKGPFSETTVYSLTFGAAGDESVVSSSSQMKAVPEPASVALLGLTLAATGAIRRRKRV